MIKTGMEMTNIGKIHRKLTIVRQQEQQQQKQQHTNSIDRDHYVARGQKASVWLLFIW